MVDIDYRDRKELRKFGLSVAVVFCVLFGLHWWRSGHVSPWMLIVAIMLSVSSLACPSALAPVLWVWLRIAFAINFIVTHVILVLTYYLVITPAGLVMRAMGHDPMKREFEPDTDTYWEDLPDEPVDKARYFKQF